MKVNKVITKSRKNSSVVLTYGNTRSSVETQSTDFDVTKERLLLILPKVCLNHWQLMETGLKAG